MYHLRRKVHFVIMTSVFDTPEKIHTVYDLKGSLIGTTYTYFHSTFMFCPTFPFTPFENLAEFTQIKLRIGSVVTFIILTY
jgi:Phosphatidylinositol-4-phosphate 5-Kinase